MEELDMDRKKGKDQIDEINLAVPKSNVEGLHLDVSRVIKNEIARRSPDRIERVMQEILQAWKDHPDYRFGQLIENIIGSSSMKERIRMFFLDDDDFEKMVDSFLKRKR